MKLNIVRNKKILGDRLVAACFFDTGRRVYYDSHECNRACGGNHPHAAVDAYDNFWCVRGQDRMAGIHTSGLKFHEHFDSENEAIESAKNHLR